MKKIKALGVGRETGDLEDPNYPGLAKKAMTVRDEVNGVKFTRLARRDADGNILPSEREPKKKLMLRDINVETRTAYGQGFVMSEEQRAGYFNYRERIGEFTEAKKAMNKEINEARSRIITDDKDDLQLQEFEAERFRIREKYNAPYREKYGYGS